jgi:hypothetical protein
MFAWFCFRAPSGERVKARCAQSAGSVSRHGGRTDHPGRRCAARVFPGDAGEREGMGRRSKAVACTVSGARRALVLGLCVGITSSFQSPLPRCCALPTMLFALVGSILSLQTSFARGQVRGTWRGSLACLSQPPFSTKSLQLSANYET